jgi:hypothetical protein
MVFFKYKLFLLGLLAISFGTKNVNPTYRCEKGLAIFSSAAPLELIEAKSKKLRGILDPATQSYAWSIENNTFEGFNSPLQQEHFNENYMETDKFPRSTFTGKIIEKIDFKQNGTYKVRAKGKLSLHGVERERIIKCDLTIKNSIISVKSNFTISLSEHNISIPKIVNQKISEEVKVSIEAMLIQ